jgi:hypothetical protein
MVNINKWYEDRGTRMKRLLTIFGAREKGNIGAWRGGGVDQTTGHATLAVWAKSVRVSDCFVVIVAASAVLSISPLEKIATFSTFDIRQESR